MPVLCLNCRGEIYPRAVIPIVEFRRIGGVAPSPPSENGRFWILCPICKEQNVFIKEYRQGGVSLCLSHLDGRRSIHFGQTLEA